MMNTKNILIIFGIVFGIIIPTFHNVNCERMIVSQYYNSDAIHRMNFFPMDLDLNSITHLNYGPFELNEYCNVVSSNPYIDYKMEIPGHNFQHKGSLGAISEIKKNLQHLKVLLTVNLRSNKGFNENFPRCIQNPHLRKKIVTTISKTIKVYNLDGINYDLDTTRGNRMESDDYLDLIDLIKETRIYMKNEIYDRRIIISTTGSIQEPIIKRMGKHMDELIKVVDFVNLMTFNYSIYQPMTQTSLNAPLFADEQHKNEKFNIMYTVELYKKMGLPTHMMVLGLASFGRGWTGADGLYERAEGPIEGNVRNGVLAFTDISTEYIGSSGYEEHRVCGVPYLYNKEKRIFISYDDEESIDLKTRFAIKNQLAGVFLYQASDDVKNILTDTVIKRIKMRNHIHKETECIRCFGNNKHKYIKKYIRGVEIEM